MTWFQGPEGSGSPSSRFGHTANLVDGSKMVVFGGWNGEDYFNDVFTLDLEAMAWSQPKCTGPIPCPRQGHTTIQIANNLLIFGGIYYQDDLQRAAGFKQGSQLRSCYLNDLRLLNTDKYEWARVRVSGAPPLPRFGHSANISGIDLVVFGGWSIKSGLRDKNPMEKSAEEAPTSLDYFMVLNVSKLCWELGKYTGTPPLSRYGHTCTSIGSHMLIFGGWEYSRATNDVIVLRDVNMFKKNK